MNLSIISKLAHHLKIFIKNNQINIFWELSCTSKHKTHNNKNTQIKNEYFCTYTSSLLFQHNLTHAIVNHSCHRNILHNICMSEFSNAH